MFVFCFFPHHLAILLWHYGMYITIIAYFNEKINTYTNIIANFSYICIQFDN
jgi:hypothetical protein